MARRFQPGKVTQATLACGVLGLACGLTAWAFAPPPEPARDEAPRKEALVKPEQLGGSERYLTYVSTDKPIYRPGETVYFRGVVLHGLTRKPSDQQMQATYEIIGPKGDTVARGGTQVQESVVGFSWVVPEGQAGGQYKVKIMHPWFGYPPGERSFDVRVYRAPRLKNQIVFVRDGYGPGDEVAATLHTERAEGGIPAGAPVTVIARVDGEEVYRGNAQVDAQGNCEARFKLPANIARGEGTLALVIDDGGAVETASKTIPILLQTVDLQMYPEGGDLVAGLPCRVYLEAKTPAKKPADIAGAIVDDQGQTVAEFRTEHEGRGRFSFTPAADRTYKLQITEPTGIKTTYALPAAKSQGAVIRSEQEVYEPGAPIKLSVAASTSSDYRLTLRQREEEKAAVNVKLTGGEPAEVSLTPAANVSGVLIATLLNGDGVPVAERLIFRRPEKEVAVQIVPDKKQYTPGGKVRLTLKTTDSSGKPVSAVVGVTATDESVLEMIEKREQAPRLPVMVLLEGEVRELADAHVYLDPQNEKAPLAVDLLLGTQGWRRFAFVRVSDFVAEHGTAARRVLALSAGTRREMLSKSNVDGAEMAAFPKMARAAGPMAGPPAPMALPPGQPAIVEKAAAKNDQDDVAVPEAAPVPRPAAAAVPIESQAGDRRAAFAPPADDPVGNPASKRAPEPALQQKPQEAFGRALEAADAREARMELVAGDEMLAPGEWSVVRVYAHQVRPNRQPGDRSDFTETVYWNAGIRTSETDGQAVIEFGLPDSVTSFRVSADAFTSGGELGAGTQAIEVVEPFYMEPKLPLEVTSGDVVELPIGIVNASDQKVQAKVTVTAANGQAGGYPAFEMKPGERLRKQFTIDVGQYTGTTQFTFEGRAGSFADKVTRPLNVKPLGFPIEVAFGGMLGPGSVARHELTIPESVIPYSVEAQARVMPTPLASMTSALERLIQEPYGCFEQTSSTTYPLVMAQQYFQTHTGVDPSLIERSNAMLAKGYQRLIGFECSQGGFEWFGQNPGHDALTAYGLLEFSDMAKVYPVDQKMVERARTWLLGQRDGMGGYKREQRTLHTWVADPELTSAYITWALLEAGETNPTLSEEIDSLYEVATKTSNPYVVALVANVQFLAGQNEAARELMARLAKLQQEDGSLTGTQSIVGSTGEALRIETTAIATLAWLRDKSYTVNVEKAIRWLAEQCKGGRYGSTQSTVLALKAVVEYDKARSTPKADGSLQLLVDGKEVGEPVAFTQQTQGVIELPEFHHLLTPGKHTIEVRMADGSEMPYTLAVNYYSVKPNSSDDCQVDLAVKLTKDRLSEGEITEAAVTVTNKSDKATPMAVAIIGLPGGLEPRHDQLKELVKSEKVAAYEVLGRDVVLYWRGFEPNEKKEVSLSLIGAVPGSYTGPASRAYLYYTDELKNWIDGLKVQITPAEQQ